MKKILVMLFAVAVLFTGCSEKKEALNIVPEDAAQTILENVTFRDMLLKAEGDVVSNYYTLDDSIAEHAVYVSGSGATAEEVAVLKVTDPAKLSDAKAILEKRVEELKRRFADYVPAEMTKLENPVLVTQGDVAVLILADDADQAKKVADSLFE